MGNYRNLNVVRLMSLSQRILKLERVASMICGCKMKVRFRGNCAYVDQMENLINFPEGDFNDPIFLDMVEGILDHECGHKVHTPNALKSRRFNPIKNNLINIFEDVRMENRVFADYRQARKNLNKLVDAAIKKDWFGAPPADQKLTPVNVVMNFILIHARAVYCEQSQLLDFAIAWGTEVDKIDITLRPKLETICVDLADGLAAQACVEKADAVIALLAQANEDVEPEPPSQPPQQSDSDDDPTDSQDEEEESQTEGEAEDTDGDSNDAGNDNSDVNGTPSDSQDTDGDPDTDSCDTTDSDSDSDSDSGNSTSGESSDDTQNDGADDNQPPHSGKGGADESEDDQPLFDLDASDDDIRQTDLHDFAEELLGDLSEQATKEERVTSTLRNLTLPMTDTNGMYGAREFSHCDVAGHVGKVRGAIQKALIDNNIRKSKFSKRGSTLDCNKLIGIQMGQLNVFRKDTIVRTENCAIHILVDSSYSMNTKDANKVSDMHKANLMAYTFSYALQGIKGVVSQTAIFPGEDDHSMVIIKPFQSKTQIEGFKRSTTGFTPTGEAIAAATMALASRTEPKKLMFVITDGEPGSVTKVEDAISQANVAGIQVIALGLNTNCQGFSEEQSVVCPNVDALSNALFDAIKRNLIS